MKILFINKFFYLNGGSERVFFQERDFLRQEGHTVIDFSMKDERNLPSPYADYFVANIDYHETKKYLSKLKQGISFIHSNLAVDNIERLIIDTKPNIAHLHNIYHQLTPSIIPILKKHGAKILLTLHDYKLICPSYLALKNEVICDECQGKFFWKPFTSNCQNSRLKGFLLSIEAIWHKWRKSYDYVDCFLSPSQFLADLTKERLPRNKLKILRNGIDAAKYQSNYEDEGYALYFGRLSEEKGIKTLLKAHRSLIENVPLKIVGTGPLEEELMLSYPKALFLGYKSGKDLNELIANAAFVVVPSEWYENCSMVVLEAMAMGKPVIGSCIGGIPEQIEDGKTGFLFEMGKIDELSDKMTVLWSDKKLRAEMGKAAREKVEKEFSLQKHCADLMEIYNQLLTK